MRVSGARSRRDFRFGAPPAILAAILFVAPLGPPGAIAGEKWAPISAADLALRQPTLDPDAGAEVLLWTIRVEDRSQSRRIHTLITHEIRTKVFTAHGAEEAGRVEIAHLRDVTLRDIAARTIRPDGSVVEVSKDQIFDQMIAKNSETKVRGKSFAFPSVTPGCVLEHRWTESRFEDNAAAVFLEFQRAFPVRQIDLRLKPLPLAGSGYEFKMRVFNTPTPAFVEDRDGFQYAVLLPVPAARKEEWAPPVRHVAPWAILYYQYGPDPTPEELWVRHTEEKLRELGSAMQTSQALRKEAAEIGAMGGTPVAKADLLYDWCRTQVVNIEDDRFAISETDRQKEPKSRTPAETLKRRRGTSFEQLYLFIAMCKSIGLPARLAATTDRTEFRFDSRLGLPRMLDRYFAAVRHEDGWKFYDPSAFWLGAGHLSWVEEGQEVLIFDEKKPEFTRTSFAPPESSGVRRTATLRILDDGGAEGTIRKEYRGHWGAQRHERYDELSGEARIDRFRRDGPLYAKEAAIDSILIEGADDPLCPVVEHAMVRVPGYAQAVGSRLLVPLSFFSWKAAPTFPSTTRRLPVEFTYPWSYSDTVKIELPDGYEIEALPEFDPPITKGVARFDCSAHVSIDGRSVLFLRQFSFGVGGIIGFPVEQYPSLKRLFDDLQSRDEATLSLRRKT